MHCTLHKSIAFEAAQSLGQHFLRNPTDFALERSVTPRAAGKNLNGERCPFISNAIKHQSGRAARIEDGRNGRAFWHGSCVEQLRYRCKSECNTPKDAYGS